MLKIWTKNRNAEDVEGDPAKECGGIVSGAQAATLFFKNSVTKNIFGNNNFNIIFDETNDKSRKFT